MTMRTLEGRTRRAAQWVASAAAAALCVVGVGAPAQANEAVPTPIVSLTEPPETPILPDLPIEVWIDVRSAHIKNSSGDYIPARELHVSFHGGFDDDSRLWKEDCVALTNTLLTGQSEEFEANVTWVGERCDVSLKYQGESRHVFYSLDDAGNMQVRAPMSLVNRMMSALGEATVTQLRIEFGSINNAHCNGNPSRKSENEFLVYSNSTTCEWVARDGVTMPSTDDPLIEGEVDNTFFTILNGTVGPFMDPAVPIDPLTIPAPAAPELSEGGTDRGLVIGVSSSAIVLLLIGGASFVWALRSRS